MRRPYDGKVDDSLTIVPLIADRVMSGSCARSAGQAMNRAKPGAEMCRRLPREGAGEWGWKWQEWRISAILKAGETNLQKPG
jgi:hypothetical protein